MAPAKIVLNLTPFPANLAYFYLCGFGSTTLVSGCPLVLADALGRFSPLRLLCGPPPMQFNIC